VDTGTPLPPARKPILCYVTDRHALEPAPGTNALLAAIRSAADAGVDWIQIREKDLEARALAAVLRLALESSRGTAAKIFVNDRLDVAIAAGAGGVHLGENVPASANGSRVAAFRRPNRISNWSVMPFDRSLESGAGWRHELHLLRTCIPNSIESGVRPSAGNRTIARSLHGSANSGARHWRRHS